MRHLIIRLLLVTLFSTGLFSSSFLSPQRAVAQIPVVPLIGYGQTISGEVTAATGNEHTFTGCAGEVVGMSVSANDFSPRIEVYYADEVDPLATATAKSGAAAIRSFSKR